MINDFCLNSGQNFWIVNPVRKTMSITFVIWGIKLIPLVRFFQTEPCLFKTSTNLRSANKRSRKYELAVIFSDQIRRLILSWISGVSD